MTKLNESQIIREFQKILGNRDFVPEDIEVFNLGKTKIVAKVDTLVQSTDFPPKMSLFEAARKSIVACVSDFAAKGSKPEFSIISINLPMKITEKTKEIAKGFKYASKEFGFSILGGDTNQGKEIVFNVCMFGVANKISRRKGAKEGDLIFVTGPFGYTSAGLKILFEKIKADKIFHQKAVKSVLKPMPRLNFGISTKKYFSSSMDSSDGLSTTLIEMAKQSKCKFVIDKIPCKKNLVKFCEQYKSNLESMVFHGGEEYEIVFTASAKNKSQIVKIAKKTKTPLIEIGKVLKGNGVFIQKNQKLKKISDLGYHHFIKTREK